jgi:transcriptional regulator with XRE-family HTH domain
MGIGIRIATWRRARGLTQADLAVAAGVTVSAVSYWEAGKSTPSHAHLEAIVARLGLTMAQFYGRLPKQAAA